MKPTICVDFDGVIHSYTSGWITVDCIPDSPVAGAFKWLSRMLKYYTVAIFSSRSRDEYGLAAMKKWFKTHGFSQLDQLSFPTDKPAAIMYIDDRARLFSGPGTYPTKKEIDSFVPWNK